VAGGGGDIFIHEGEVAKVVNCGTGYGSPSGEWRQRIGFLARVCKFEGELVQQNGNFNLVLLSLWARAKLSAWVVDFHLAKHNVERVNMPLL
jgi:hypothetical protein